MAGHLSRFPSDHGEAPVNHLLTLLLFYASLVDVRQLRKNDQSCFKIRTALRSDCEETRQKFSRHYVMKDDVLYRLMYKGNRIHFLMVIPNALRLDILKESHNNFGRGGIHCQIKKNPLTGPADLLQTISVHGPFHTIGIGYRGPFTLSSRQNHTC